MNCIRILILLGATTGCAQLSPQKGFEDVKRTTETRLGSEIFWNEGDRPEGEAARRITELLSCELTADSAVQLALLNNSGLQSRFHALGVAQADMIQAGLLSNPFLSAELKFRHGGPTKVELSLVQEILGLFYLSRKQAIGEAAFEEAKLSASAAVIDLAAEVRRAFIELQAAEQEVALRQTVVETLSASYDLAKRMKAAGNITSLQLLNERSLLEEGKLALSDGETEVLEKRENMNAFLGVWGSDVSWTIPNRLPEVPLGPTDASGLESRAVERSLDLKIAENAILLSQVQAEIAGPLGLFSESEAGGATEREDGKWAAGPAIGIPIPILDSGQATGYRATFVVKQKQALYRDLAVTIRANVRKAYARTEAARQKALYLKLVVVPLRRDIVSDTQKEYNAMLVGAFDLLRAKRDEIAAGAEYVRALKGYWVSQGDFQQVLNGRLPTERRTESMEMGSETNESADH